MKSASGGFQSCFEVSFFLVDTFLYFLNVFLAREGPSQGEKVGQKAVLVFGWQFLTLCSQNSAKNLLKLI